MADKRSRRRLAPEFKAQAVKRVLDGRSLSRISHTHYDGCTIASASIMLSN
jgi:transposase-like protein